MQNWYNWSQNSLLCTFLKNRKAKITTIKICNNDDDDDDDDDDHDDC